MSEQTTLALAYGEDNDGWYIAIGDLQIAHGMTEDDARRIVACVNACAGISTAELEAEGSAVMGYIRTARKLIEVAEQRDLLLKMLESIRKITGDAAAMAGRTLERGSGELAHVETQRMLALAREYLNDTSKAASRAVASVKGGA